MTIDWIALGKSPQSEPVCFNNEKWAEKYKDRVLLAWFNQIRRTFPCFPDRIVIKQSGDEYFVVVTFENEIQFEYAKDLADELPFSWDDKAKEELGATYFKETREIYCSTEKDK